MKTRNKLPHNSFIKTLVMTAISLLIWIVPSFCQDVTSADYEWCIIVLQKHNIDISKFNYRNLFDMSKNDTINDLWLELGTIDFDSLKNTICQLKDVILISKGENDTYWLRISPIAYQDFENKTIEMTDCNIERFSFKSKDILPIESYKFQKKKFDIKESAVSTSLW